MVEGLGPNTLCRKRSAMAGVGILHSLWEKPIWEGVWPNLDPLDSVCSRTGDHGVECAREVWPASRALFFSLIQKEPATVPGCETPFVNADIRTTLFSADVLKKCDCRLAPNCGRKRRRRWRSCPWSTVRGEIGLPKESNVGE